MRENFAATASDGAGNGYFCKTRGNWTVTHHDSLEWKKLVLFALLAPIVFSGAMEIAQKVLTIYRQADWADFLANSLGVLCGLLVALLIIRPVVWAVRKKGSKC